MEIYSAYGVLIEILRTQLLEYALSKHQNRPPHKVLKRHKRIMLAMELLGEQKTKQKRTSCPELSRCLELYARLIPEMLKAERAEQQQDIYTLLSDKIANVSKVNYERFGNLYTMLMTTGMTRHQMSEEAVLEKISPTIHKYITVDVQRGVVSQRLIMKADSDRQLGVKELLTNHVIDVMQPERRAQLYTQLELITNQIVKNCRNLKLLFAGGTGQYVSMVRSYPKSLEKVREIFSPSDIDLKVNSDVSTPELVKRAKHELCNQILKLQIPTALDQVFTFEAAGIRFRPRPIQFYRNVVTDSNIQYEYYRFKQQPSPILLDIIEIQEKRNLVTIAVRLRYVMTASLIDGDESTPKGSYTFRTDLMDISISAESRIADTQNQELVDMKLCGNNLLSELEYQHATTGEIFNAVRRAILTESAT